MAFNVLALIGTHIIKPRFLATEFGSWLMTTVGVPVARLGVSQVGSVRAMDGVALTGCVSSLDSHSVSRASAKKRLVPCDASCYNEFST